MINFLPEREPVIHSTMNADVYQPEYVVRQPDETNIIQYDQERYEYSLPKSFLITGNIAQKVINPFNTTAQCALLYVQFPGTSEVLQFTYDRIDQMIQSGVTISDFPGIIIHNSTSAMLASLTPYWIDFQQFVYVQTSGVTNYASFVLGFRRQRDRYIPRNYTPFNELNQ